MRRCWTGHVSDSSDSESARVSRGVPSNLRSRNVTPCPLAWPCITFPRWNASVHCTRAFFRTLRPAGVFVNADVTMSAHPVRQEQCYRIWAGHLVSCGIDERRAYEHFDEWASEDTYFPLDDELTAMREAGI